MRNLHALVILAVTTAVAACAHGKPASEMATIVVAPPTLPPDGAGAQARLAASPRHGEWAMIRTGPNDSIRSWVVFPERSDKAPVVLVVHEINGLSHWVRAVADQLAADGFIAIAPDLLTMKGVPAGADGAPNADSARAVIRTLDMDDVHRQLRAIAEYGMSLPAAEKSYGIVGYCWGGSVSFAHAARFSDLGASVVYYGTSPDAAALQRVEAPVLGLYGGNDARVNATIAPADSVLELRGKTYDPHIFEGAGHGFLRAQSGQEGANLRATQAAWPLTISWFRRHL